MNKFLKDLEKELKNLKVSEKDIKEILDDHKEMIEAAMNDGLDELQIEEKFGKPKTLAKDLQDDTSKLDEKTNYNFSDVGSCVKVDTNSFNLVKTFPMISEEFSITIGLISDDFNLTPYDGESIQVYEKNVKKIEEYTILFEKNELLIKKDKVKIKVFSFSSNSGEFLVLVPKDIDISKFDYKTVSGDANVNGVKSEDINVKSTSGDLELTNIDGKNMKFTTVSGDIEILRLQGNQFEVSVVSGDLEMKHVVIKGNMELHSVSGDVELFEVECEEADFKTVSGDLEGNEFYPSQVSLKSVSGDITITNRNVLKDINIISKKTVSGDININ
jgi:DUF4097 and DUF4098 domain-containing protein YvlB